MLAIAQAASPRRGEREDTYAVEPTPELSAPRRQPSPPVRSRTGALNHLASAELTVRLHLHDVFSAASLPGLLYAGSHFRHHSGKCHS